MGVFKKNFGKIRVEQATQPAPKPKPKPSPKDKHGLPLPWLASLPAGEYQNLLGDFEIFKGNYGLTRVELVQEGLAVEVTGPTEAMTAAQPEFRELLKHYAGKANDVHWEPDVTPAFVFAPQPRSDEKKQAE